MFTTEQYSALTFEEKLKVMGFKAKFHTKKAAATAAVERIKKNGWNDFHKYHYATESDVKDGIRGVLADNGLSYTNDLLQRTETDVNTKNGKATKTDLQMKFVLTDTETGYFEEYFMDGVAIDNGDKGIYKAYSSTIKYFFMDMFLIPTGDEVEKDSPQIKGQEAPQGRGDQPQGQSQGKQPNGGNKPQNGPDWRKILDAEKEVAALSGQDLGAVRKLLNEKLGNVGKYKEMNAERIEEVMAYLNGCIAYYKQPQPQQ